MNSDRFSPVFLFKVYAERHPGAYMASVVFYALGERQPDVWDSSVPKNMFTGLA